jgi:hypothetical protein
MFFLQAVRGLSGAFIRLPRGGRSEPLGRDLRKFKEVKGRVLEIAKF